MPGLRETAWRVLVGTAAEVVLVERWAREPAWRDRRLSSVIVAAALASTFALVAAAVALGAAVLFERVPARERLRRIGRVVVPVGLIAVALVSGIDLVLESNRILG
jgi:hypothetical protein